MNAPSRFAFAAATLLSWADVQKKAVTDRRIPVKRRAGVLSSLSKVPTWVGQDASAIVFVEPVIEGLFRRLRADVLGVSSKRLRNARSDIRFVLGLYGGPRRYLAPFTPAAQRLWDMLSSKYERCSLSRLLRFLSAQGIDPASIDERISLQFLEALRTEARLRLKPEIFHQNSIRAWNKAAILHADWPRESWARPWADFPASLEQSVDRFLAAGPEPTSLFDEHAPVAALRPTTRKTQKEHFRCAASALARADVPIDMLVGLRSLCAPERVKVAIAWLVRHRQGRIGGYVEGVMWTLVKTARHSGVLRPQEISEVDRLYQSLALRRSTERRTHKDRDQNLLAQLDTPGTMDAFLSLAARTVERVLKSGRRSMVAAREIRRALAIELWLCAPLRLENFVQLRLDQSFHTMRLDGQDRIVVRVPAEQVKYQRQQLEHFLSDDAKELLELYVKEFRPLMVSGPSPWLFPGRRGQPMVAAAFSTDMKRFVHGAVGIDFHPHLMRKIAVKIVPDANPAEIEIARRQRGHAHANTTRKSYTQHQQRAAQQRYLDILEGRRLVALRQGTMVGKDHA